jgi:hypothetical protein
VWKESVQARLAASPYGHEPSGRWASSVLARERVAGAGAVHERGPEQAGVVDVGGAPRVVGEVPLGLDPQVLADPARGVVRAGDEVGAPGGLAGLEQAGGREGRHHDVGAAGRVEAPARLHVPRVAPGDRPGVELVERAQGQRARLARAGEPMGADPDRAEDPDGLGDQRMRAAVEPAHVDRGARVQLDERLAPAHAPGERAGPTPPERVERVRPAEAAARRRRQQGDRRIDAPAREGVTRHRRHGGDLIHRDFR